MKSTIKKGYRKMKKDGKRMLWIGSILLVAFAIWTALIQIVDVQPLGPKETNVGFATWNGLFHKWTGVHMTIYTITDWLGLVPIFVCMLFGGIGFVQLIKRRSFLKVDFDIIILGIYYVIVIISYLTFEMLPINYRPILIDGRLEASYPSSTTLLVLSVMPTLLEQMHRRVRSIVLKRMMYSLASCFSICMVMGRLVSGVHWFTDIVGAVLLSAGLFCMYKAVILLYGKMEEQCGIS